MPVQECRLNGKPGYKWGEQGHCYTYIPGDKQAQQRARNQAEEQGIAIQANQGKEQKEDK